MAITVRTQLLESESQSYHDAGTCTFYGTANSNQMLLEALGLHVPGAAFIHPHAELREALTRDAVRTLLGITKGANFTPIGRLVDERVIVNAMVALLATGGSTNSVPRVADSSCTIPPIADLPSRRTGIT